MVILDFLVSGWHGFGSVTQVCFGISVSNFMCMSFVAVGRSLTIVSYVAFKMAALWFWTMFKCNPPIAHCHPLLWGGGILVDHWSTISSFGLVYSLASFFKGRPTWIQWSGCPLSNNIFEVVVKTKFSWIKIVLFLLKFHSSLFLRVKLTIVSIGLGNDMVPNRHQVIIWTNVDLAFDAIWHF